MFNKISYNGSQMGDVVDFGTLNYLPVQNLINMEKDNLKQNQEPTTFDVIRDLHEALKNLLQATDDEGWSNDNGEDWEEQEQARKALANTPINYLQ